MQALTLRERVTGALAIVAVSYVLAAFSNRPIVTQPDLSGRYAPEATDVATGDQIPDDRLESI